MVILMEIWALEVFKTLNRLAVDILFGEHAAKDKNLTEEDVDYAIDTVRIGKVEINKSSEENKRICFKNYYKEKGISYFVVTEYYPTFIKIVTVIKKRGKY